MFSAGEFQAEHRESHSSILLFSIEIPNGLLEFPPDNSRPSKKNPHGLLFPSVISKLRFGIYIFFRQVSVKLTRGASCRAGHFTDRRANYVVRAELTSFTATSSAMDPRVNSTSLKSCADVAADRRFAMIASRALGRPAR